MGFRFAALFLLCFGLALGVSVLVSTGANSLVKQILGLSVPFLAGASLAWAWWQRAGRHW